MCPCSLEDQYLFKVISGFHRFQQMLDIGRSVVSYHFRVQPRHKQLLIHDAAHPEHMV
jgi:hypothetical protein